MKTIKLHPHMLLCRTCRKWKHDTAFDFKYWRFLFWKYNTFELDTSKCQDCKYPKRWDGVRTYVKEYIGKLKR